MVTTQDNVAMVQARRAAKKAAVAAQIAAIPTANDWIADELVKAGLETRYPDGTPVLYFEDRGGVVYDCDWSHAEPAVGHDLTNESAVREFAASYAKALKS